MKNFILTACMIGMFFSCKDFAKKPDRGKSIPSTSNLYGIKYHAESVKAALLDSCKYNGNLKMPSQVDITPKMYQLIEYSNYKFTCDIIEEFMGKPTSVELADSFFSRNQLLLIYRYKFTCEKIDEPLELRIVFTADKKLTEFQFFDWHNKYREDLIRLKWF